MQAGKSRAESAVRSYRTLGLDADARVALGCMMEVLQGRTRMEWLACAQDEADVYFAASHAIPPHRQGSARQVVHVVRHGEGHAGYAHHVDYPFRVFQLLSVLLEIEEEVSSASGGAGLQVSHPSWALYDSLQRLGDDSGSGDWLGLGANDAVLYVRGDLQEVALSPAMERQLTEGRIPPRGLTPVSAPPAGQAREDSERLLWCVGLHAGRGNLSDALDPALPYRLRAWPDFGRLPATRDHLRLCALLASDARRRDDLVEHLGGDPGTRIERVNRFLNACGASGLLKAEHREAPPARNPAPAGGFVAGLVSRLRSRLGIGARVAHG